MGCVFTTVAGFGFALAASGAALHCPGTGDVVDTDVVETDVVETDVVETDVATELVETDAAGTGVMVTMLSITFVTRELVSVGRAGKAKAPPEKVTTPSIEVVIGMSELEVAADV